MINFDRVTLMHSNSICLASVKLHINGDTLGDGFMIEPPLHVFQNQFFQEPEGGNSDMRNTRCDGQNTIVEELPQERLNQLQISRLIISGGLVVIIDNYVVVF